MTTEIKTFSAAVGFPAPVDLAFVPLSDEGASEDGGIGDEDDDEDGKALDAETGDLPDEDEDGELDVE